MKYSVVAASAAAGLVSLVAAAPQQYNVPAPEIAHLFPRQKPVLACSNSTGGVHVIAVPGEGFADPPYGLIGSLATSILKAIPGSTNVSVPYNHSNPNGVSQTMQATNNLNSYILQYHYYCPTTKIVLLGYSSGAVDVMNSLCGESNPPYSPNNPPLNHGTYGQAIIAAATYGDETRTAGASYNRGTCTGVGLHPRENPGGCKVWAGKIHGWCDKGDPECCATTGNNISDHYVYPMEYDQVATRFVVNKFQKSIA